MSTAPSAGGPSPVFRSSFDETEGRRRHARDEGVGLIEVAITEHATTYSVPDTETLWRGGLGSLVLTGAAIKQQDRATQDLIRTAFERCASVYRSANGLNLPIAFKVGSGQRPT
jgi:hypothetical protein